MPDGSLHGRIDQQPLNGLRIAQDGRGGATASRRQLLPVVPQYLHGLGARGEAGDLPLHGSHTLNGACERVRFARASPTAQHYGAITGIKNLSDRCPLLRRQFLAGCAHQIPQFGHRAGGSVELRNQRTLQIERGASRHLAADVKEAGMMATSDGLFDDTERVLAVGLAEDLGGKFVDGHDGLSLKQVFGGPLDGDG